MHRQYLKENKINVIINIKKITINNVEIYPDYTKIIGDLIPAIIFSSFLLSYSIYVFLLKRYFSF